MISCQPHGCCLCFGSIHTDSIDWDSVGTSRGRNSRRAREVHVFRHLSEIGIASQRSPQLEELPSKASSWFRQRRTAVTPVTLPCCLRPSARRSDHDWYGGGLEGGAAATSGSCSRRRGLEKQNHRENFRGKEEFFPSAMDPNTGPSMVAADVVDRTAL